MRLRTANNKRRAKRLKEEWFGQLIRAAESWVAGERRDFFTDEQAAFLDACYRDMCPDLFDTGEPIPVSELQALLDLTDHQYGIILSTDQNGHFLILASERKHVDTLIEDGLLELTSPTVARLTPKLEALLDERRRRNG